ncbi:glutaredoxin 3 [Sphingomonas parva]|uniref:Glutaredoxin n=1 Tax=Sphingomonas parva TaxID=2555898 RepID=A0A4Y8ZNA1_9SPHN|nr:glutaredoxin 3 [Sphingomonas parva]TFI57434.1 glutaredoxin 3 [Sphingomonas parva]
MARVEIYTKFTCPYCARAKRLLEEKGASYEEYELNALPGKRDEMIERANGRFTVPQIFIDGRHIGGSDDLAELDRRGGLDPLLNGGAAA